jgi:hypothetical protein
MLGIIGPDKVHLGRGAVAIVFEPENGDRLLSPDNSQQLLPCERCGAPKWVLKNCVSFTCSACADEEDIGEEPMSEAAHSYAMDCCSNSVYRY